MSFQDAMRQLKLDSSIIYKIELYFVSTPNQVHETLKEWCKKAEPLYGLIVTIMEEEFEYNNLCQYKSIIIASTINNTRATEFVNEEPKVCMDTKDAYSFRKDFFQNVEVLSSLERIHGVLNRSL